MSETNIPHQFQGNLRFAPLNVKELNIEIMKDVNKLSPHISKKITLAVTCLDQIEEKITVAQAEGNLIELSKNEFLDHVCRKTEFDNYLMSNGPTRKDCKGLVNN